MSMAAEIPHPLPSPGVGARRKGPKGLPKLPLSAFTPPNTGASDSFPFPPSPSTIHPQKVIDAHVISADVQLAHWKNEAAQRLGDKTSGVVLSLQGMSAAEVEKALESLHSNKLSVPIISVLVPFPLENGVPSKVPSFLASSSKTPVHLITSFTKSTPQLAEGIKWALQKGYVVDLDVQCYSRDGGTCWESLVNLLENTLAARDDQKGVLVLTNVIPPPQRLDVPIVKLLTHPNYLAYQSNMAAFSLFPNVHVKFLPPIWNAPTSVLNTPSDDKGSQEVKDKKAWKRRIKMYLGPAVEAFGYRRIIYGSSPSPASKASSNAGDWYELARESLTEIGLEQIDIDAVFYGNAQRVYTSGSS